jgi:hypothetical protein
MTDREPSPGVQAHSESVGRRFRSEISLPAVQQRSTAAKGTLREQEQTILLSLAPISGWLNALANYPTEPIIYIR